MESNPAEGTSRWRRLRLALAAFAAAALVLVLAAAAGAVGVDVAVDGCLAFALLAAASYAFVNAGYAEKYSAATVMTWQMVGAFTVLAWLTYRAGNSPLPAPIISLLFMFYGALHLTQVRLALLALVALFLHGSAVLLLLDRGALTSAAAGVQIVALTAACAWVVYAAGSLVRLRFRLAEARSRLHEFEQEANERASRDALTGVYHQRHLMDALEREIARSERIGKPLSVARVDLDWLGALNAAHGQIAGDVALRRFTAAATGALRDVDVFGRHGGKEFLALMPDTDLKGAIVAAERLRAAVAKEPMPEADGRRHLSCTLGVAEHRKGENTRLVIGRAEAGLAYGKAAGRDRVVALDADGNPLLIEAA